MATSIDPRPGEPSPAVLARLAGLLYAVIIVCGISAEVIVRSSLVVAGDPDATAANILAAPGLYRLGFAADSVMLLADVGLALLLYLLLRPVHRTLALAAMLFRLTQALILGVNLLLYYAVLLLLSQPPYAAAIGVSQANSLALLFLDLHAHGYDLGLIFFGVANLLLGRLLLRDDRFPAWLGYGLIAAALVYIGGSYIRFLAPSQYAMVQPAYLLPLLAESAFCLWLLFKGGSLGSAASPADSKKA